MGRRVPPSSLTDFEVTPSQGSNPITPRVATNRRSTRPSLPYYAAKHFRTLVSPSDLGDKGDVLPSAPFRNLIRAIYGQ